MKTVIDMARSAGGYRSAKYPDEWRMDDDDLERFAELVRADEREACVQDIQMHIPRSGRDTTEYQRAMRMIERIRARGQA